MGQYGMRFSSDQMAEVDAQIEQHMIQHPCISIARLSETLGHSKSFIAARKRKIHRRNTEEIKRMTVEEDLGKIKSFMDSALPKITDIICSENSKNGDKINAFRAVLACKMAFFDKKCDAGVFERQVRTQKTGEKMTAEEKATMERALDWMLHPVMPVKYIEQPHIEIE